MLLRMHLWKGSNMAIRIITDSTADYSREELIQKDIISVPLSVSFGEEHYQDGINITAEEFYKKLKESSTIPQTSQPSPAAFLEHFTKAKECGDTVVAILISGELSGTLQSAQIAKDMCDYDGIYIIDSKLVTAGLKLLVDKAVHMRAAGADGQEIKAFIEGLKHRVHIRAVVDTLEYLYKGGRLTRLQAGLGTMTGVKPILTTDEEGRVAVCGKVRGRAKACQSIISELKECGRDEDYPLYFLYSGKKNNYLDLVARMALEGMAIEESTLTSIGPAIGAHSGSGAFGVVYAGK